MNVLTTLLSAVQTILSFLCAKQIWQQSKWKRQKLICCDQLGMWVCVCVCVCVNWGRNGRREVHHFLFFLILRNKNKMGGDDENDVTNLFWRAFDAIYSLLLSRSLLLQRARLHHQVWPMSGSDLGSLFSLRQKWVWSKALLRGDRWKFTKSLDCSVTHLCFSFLAAGLQWLVKKRWKNS